MSPVTQDRPGPVVLYVDDEHGNRVVFEQSLRSEFPEIRTAQDGPSALRVFEEADVAVVVTDMRMPGMSGEELLKIVMSKYPATMRVVVTAYSDIDPILRAINDGLVARYMIKPWNHDELVHILRWAVETWTFGRDHAELQKRLLQTERLATIGMFAEMFMHDLRTPVNSAMLNHDMIGEMHVPKLEQVLRTVQLAPEVRAEIDEVIGDLRRSQSDVAVALGMAKDFLASMSEFGKPSKPGEKPPEADPLAIVRHSVTVCQSLAMKHNAQIDYRMPTTLPHVRITPVALTQILVNLLQNGTQAVAARGLKNGQVSIVARARIDEVELRVHDQGVGMPPDVLSRVGTPFFTTKTEGTGLGLAQCQRLVGTAGGRLQIESEPGVGTTVTIILPTAA